MTDIIQLLPDHVANQIAAGEVVQRPASVVKELLENAIDAGATEIKLIVKDGGKTLIQVVDNGLGMSQTDARLAFERHATSKIKSAEDLFQLNTKGFRGEALASIAAIAHVDLYSKRAIDEVGTQLKIEGSTVIAQEIAVTPTGTSIAVKNLFFNIPARRNFLKSNQIELKHITDEFHRVALIHSDIAFSYYHNGSELFNLPQENFRQRIVHIFGSKMNERLVPVKEDTEVVRIEGFVIKPEFAKKSRGEQFFFANQRFIKSPYLHHSISAAYEGLMRSELQPGYFLQLTVDPGSIDINIHPTKTEVKFDDEQTLYAIIRSAAKHSLGQFNVAPVLDFERDGNLDTPYNFQQKEAVLPKVTVDPSFNPFSDANSRISSGNNSFKSSASSAKGWENLLEITKADSSSFSSVQFESSLPETQLFESEEKEIGGGALTFQLKNKFIVTRVKSALVVINQNRAHERVLYENFLTTLTNGTVVSQELLFPVSLKFTDPEMLIFSEIIDNLSAIGFKIEQKIREKELVVSAIPSLLTEANVGTVLGTMIKDFDSDDLKTNFSTIELSAKHLAKSMAIKNGQALEQEAQEALVNNLFGCNEPQLSPFKKRTYITMADNELENRFN